MKRITLTGNLLKVFAMIAMLSGCQNEDFVAQHPQTDITANDKNAKNIFTPQLLKEGANELEYYGDYDVNRGKLKKLTNAPEGAYTEYQYTGQTITAQRKKISTNAPVYTINYLLDGSGRCVESTSSETQKISKYEYGPSGRLIKVYNKLNPNERLEFEYVQDPLTLLKTVTIYNQAGTATTKNTFSYMIQGGMNTIQNNYQTNPDALGVTSKYLPIFGIFHFYLPTYDVSENLLTSQVLSANSLTYVFNSTGYVKSTTATSSISNYALVTNRTYTTPKL